MAVPDLSPLIAGELGGSQHTAATQLRPARSWVNSTSADGGLHLVSGGGK